MRGPPLGKLVLIRVIMEPLRQYLAKQFERASDKMDHAEKCKQAKAHHTGSPLVRRLRIVEVAEGNDDQDFARQLNILSSTDAFWTLMPPSFHTVGRRALAFQCVARIGCAHHRLLASRHQRFPFRTFLLLSHPEMSVDLANVSECIMDNLGQGAQEVVPELVRRRVPACPVHCGCPVEGGCFQHRKQARFGEKDFD